MRIVKSWSAPWPSSLPFSINTISGRYNFLRGCERSCLRRF